MPVSGSRNIASANYVASSARELLDRLSKGAAGDTDSKLTMALAAAHPRRLPSYVDAIRLAVGAYRYDHQLGGYRHLTRAEPSSLEKRLLTESECGPFLLMCSSNGFQRQRALDFVQKIPNACCLGIVIVRLNDWVHEVQSAALRALDRLRHELSRNDLIECYGLYLATRDWGRIQPLARAKLDEMFRTAVADDDLVDAIVADTSNRSIDTLRKALALGHLHRHLPRIAREARLAPARLLATRALLRAAHQRLQGGSDHQSRDLAMDREAHISHAIADTSPAVRLLGLRTFAETEGVQTHATATLTLLLRDPSLAVAASAAFWLKRNGGDPAKQIRDWIGSSQPLPASTVCLLGTIGDASDLNALLEQADQRKGRARWALLATAGKIAPDRILPIVEAAALGDDLREARRASRTLAALGLRLDHTTLRDHAGHPVNFIERGFMRLASVEPPWKRASILLTLAIHGYPAELLRSQLARLQSQSARHWRPNEADRAELASLLAELPIEQRPEFEGVRWLVQTTH